MKLFGWSSGVDHVKPTLPQKFTVKKDLLMLCTDFMDEIPKTKYVVIKISEDG